MNSSRLFCLIASFLAFLYPSAVMAERLQRTGGTSPFPGSPSYNWSPAPPQPELQGYASQTRAAASEESFADFSAAPGIASNTIVNTNAFAGRPAGATARGYRAGSQKGGVGIAPQSSGYRPSFSATLSQQDLAVLGSRDVVVLIDKSGSMGDQDCPAPEIAGGGGMARGILNIFATASGVRGYRSPMVSRWHWAGGQLMNLAGTTSTVLPQGLKLVFFDGGTHVYPNVRMQDIPNLFARHRPDGSTDVTNALKEQLNDYFNRRAKAPQQTRPLAIAVITDGLPNNSNSLKSLIAENSRRIAQPGEISITFLQIGRERTGFELLSELDDCLHLQGAKYDIVDTKVFPEVLRFGLARALVLSITERAH